MTSGARNEATPVMRQFLAAKQAYPHALLFFRMGDFYELFYDDAVIASKALELTLTSRNKGAADEIPMAGVPHHAASGYIQRLLEQGFTVAICEQMADPSKVKGIVPREVVRVVTPSFVYDDAGIRARENSFLVAVAKGENAYGVAALDLSTGELIACEAPDELTAISEVVRLEPRELLVSQEEAAIAERAKLLRSRISVRMAEGGEADAMAALEQTLGKGEAEKSCPSAIARLAAARSILLARACEPGKELPVPRLVPYALGDVLALDEATQRHLELVATLDGENRGALLTQIDETCTAAGARLLRRRLLAPLALLGEIKKRHDAVELFVTQPGLRTELRSRFSKVGDLERLAVKLFVGRASPRDLSALRASLHELPEIADALAKCPDKTAKETLTGNAKGKWIDVCADARDLVTAALVDDPPVRASDGQVIREGFDRELDEARDLTRNGQELILALETRLRESSKIPSLKLKSTRVFGWYIEVSKSYVERAPKEWRRKQTIATGERFTSDELDELADKLAHAEDRFRERETHLFGTLVRDLAKSVARFRAVAATIAEWDVASALAEVAHRHDYVRPQLNDSCELVIEQGRHPTVERLSAAGRFVPNDLCLNASQDVENKSGPGRLWFITGPNMAGKSTLMRQAALIVILAQMGSFVPAKSATIGLVDRVLTRVGASDNLAMGESTFMVEMKETANVLRLATRRSLVVLDEIGRGTSTFDGLAIAWAVAEHLHDAVKCRALFATHYHELTELALSKDGCRNYSVSAREHEGDLVFFHKLQEGAASRSYGVACARLAGVPEIVVARAKTILDSLEQGDFLSKDEKGAKRPQLDLFQPAKEHPATAFLRALDTDRVTPLEALTLLAKLKSMTEEKG